MTRPVAISDDPRFQAVYIIEAAIRDVANEGDMLAPGDIEIAAKEAVNALAHAGLLAD